MKGICGNWYVCVKIEGGVCRCESVCAVLKRLRWYGPLSKYGTDQALTQPLIVTVTQTWLYPSMKIHLRHTWTLLHTYTHIHTNIKSFSSV